MQLRPKSFSKLWMFVFLIKKVGFFETNQWNNLKRLDVKRRNFCLKSDWESKIAQSVPMLPFLKKGRVSREKKLRLSKIVKSWQFVVECDGMSNIFKNVQKVAFVKKTIEGFSEKVSHFEKSKSSNFAAEWDCNNKFFHSLKNWFF